MADITRADVIEYLKSATMLEISDLVKEVEETFGVTAAAAPMMMPGMPVAGAAAEAAEEKPNLMWC